MNRDCTESALSEILSEILIVGLILVLAILMFILVMGGVPFLQKTSLVAATAEITYIPINEETLFPVFNIIPRAGEPFYLTGQPGIPGGSPSASFVLNGPGVTGARTLLSDYSSQSGIYGKPLYIYRDIRGGGYWVSDSMFSANKNKYLLPLAAGEWKITMVDDTAAAPLTELFVVMGGNSSIANPLSPKTIWTNTSNLSLSNSSGYQIPFTNYGVIPYTGPNGLKMFQYNGTGAYIQGDDNPDLDYNGDLSLSLWLQPTAAGVNGYHQIVGKGQANDVNENYEMFIINRRLYFEWTDRTTNQVYHIMTTDPMQWGSPPNLNYVTMTILSGTPTLYFAGNPVPVGLYRSNNPGNNPVPPAAAPPGGTINLKDNNNPITIGKQNYPGAEFYYAGGMSEVSFYNRALTPAEIAANNATYQT